MSDDNIWKMSRNRAISLFLGGIVAAATFATGLWMMIFGSLFPQSDLIFVVSLAISPLAVVAVVAGFLVWWICLFLLTLIWSDSTNDSSDKVN